MVEDALVVLRGREEDEVLAIDEREDRCLFAVEELLHEDGGAGGAEDLAVQHVAKGGLRFVAGLGDDHALAGG